MVLASSYDINTAKKYLHATYVRTALPEKYKEENEQGGGGLFGTKQQAMPDVYKRQDKVGMDFVVVTMDQYTDLSEYDADAVSYDIESNTKDIACLLYTSYGICVL